MKLQLWYERSPTRKPSVSPVSRWFVNTESGELTVLKPKLELVWMDDLLIGVSAAPVSLTCASQTGRYQAAGTHQSGVRILARATSENALRISINITTLQLTSLKLLHMGMLLNNSTFLPRLSVMEHGEGRSCRSAGFSDLRCWRQKRLVRAQQVRMTYIATCGRKLLENLQWARWESQSPELTSWDECLTERCRGLLCWKMLCDTDRRCSFRISD